jgi:pilus assembly protein Flp/PilA
MKVLLSWFRTAVRAFWTDGGVTAIEYALIASLVALAIITSMTLVGTKLVTFFNSLATKL